VRAYALAVCQSRLSELRSRPSLAVMLRLLSDLDKSMQAPENSYHAWFHEVDR
jgi:hypothetical protein